MMQKFGTLQDAIALAEFAHRNQLDKAGMSYVDHPKRVLQSVQAQGALPYVQIAAVLHDVTEDTPYTPEMLVSLGFSEAAVEVIKLLDRGYSSGEFDKINHARDVGGTIKGKSWYIALGPDGRDEFYYYAIRQDPAALMIKKADIRDNTAPWRMSYLSEETQTRLWAKYGKAMKYLEFAEKIELVPDSAFLS